VLGFIIFQQNQRRCSVQFLLYRTATFIFGSYRTSSWCLYVLSLSFGVVHGPFACQRWGLPHRLAQCV